MNLILAALFFARLAYCQSADINWNKALSPNFEVNYQTQKPSALDLERIKSGVFMEMSSVTPVSFKEKIKIFIYDKKEDYLKDAIIPPQWSLGMADQQNGRIITYWEGNDIFPVIAHETAHIFFYSFFSEKNKTPPRWLNEGFAMMFSDIMQPVGKKEWEPSLFLMSDGKIKEFDKLFKTEPSSATAKEDASDWYTQAYGVSRFIFQPRRRISLRALCSYLRAGEETEKAFWRAFGYGSFKVLKKSWQSWFADEKKQYKLIHPSSTAVSTASSSGTISSTQSIFLRNLPPLVKKQASYK